MSPADIFPTNSILYKPKREFGNWSLADSTSFVDICFKNKEGCVDEVPACVYVCMTARDFECLLACVK